MLQIEFQTVYVTVGLVTQILSDLSDYICLSTILP